MDATLDVPTSTARHVAVAIDAAGGGGARRYTYVVPPELEDLAPGEAVLVEFGRRQALAVVLAEAPPPPDGLPPVPGFPPEAPPVPASIDPAPASRVPGWHSVSTQI